MWIPVWGSYRSAQDHWDNGRPWRGLFNGMVAASDVSLLKSVVTTAWKGAAWKLGSHRWGATRKWLLKKGLVEPGKDAHHWLLRQNEGIAKLRFNWLKNQPWNLTPMASKAFHTAVHSKRFNAFGRFWYGTPSWFKNLRANLFSRSLNSWLDDRSSP